MCLIGFGHDDRTLKKQEIPQSGYQLDVHSNDAEQYLARIEKEPYFSYLNCKQVYVLLVLLYTVIL